MASLQRQDLLQARGVEALEAAGALKLEDVRRTVVPFEDDFNMSTVLAAAEYLLYVDVENASAKKPQFAWRRARLTIRDRAWGRIRS